VTWTRLQSRYQPSMISIYNNTDEEWQDFIFGEFGFNLLKRFTTVHLTESW